MLVQSTSRLSSLRLRAQRSLLDTIARAPALSASASAGRCDRPGPGSGLPRGCLTSCDNTSSTSTSHHNFSTLSYTGPRPTYLRRSSLLASPSSRSPAQALSHSTKASPPTQTSESSTSEDDSQSAMTSASEDAYGRAFNNNSLWRRSLKETDPELFERLGKGQAPQILWIGCADSRCPETTILGLQPGEIFCHRNIANILVSTDINSLSVIQYAVQYLKVKHIIICGHTSCGGIAAALENKRLGLIDTWLMPLRTLRRENLALLESLNETDRGLKLVELNVRSGCKVLLENPIVIDAIADRNLQIHGLIYNVGTGELRELDIEEDEDVVKGRKTAFRVE